MVDKKKSPLKNKKQTPSKHKENIASKEQPTDPFELVRLRNCFYRDSYRRLILLLLLTLMTLSISAYIVYYMYSHKPAPQYFATNISGGIVPLVPLNQPSLQQDEVNLWGVRAVQAALNLNYVQYRTQLSNALGTYFTDRGSQAFQKALKDSLNLENLVANNLIQIASPTAAPELLGAYVGKSGDYKGRYTWVIKFPIELTFWKGGSAQSSEYIMVQLAIMRSSVLVDNLAKNIDATRGIAINQIIMSKTTQQSSAQFNLGGS